MNSMRTIWPWVVAFVLVVGGPSALAQCGGPLKLLASDGSADARLGRTVAFSGDVAVIGADGDLWYGAAYVYRWDGQDWVQEAKLTASDKSSVDYFGYRVAISNDTIVISAKSDDDSGADSGSAYVFVKPAGGWSDMTETTKLLASDGVAGDEFGYSAAIFGNTIVVGTQYHNASAGAAYVFQKPSTGWGSVSSPITQTAKLTASDAASDDGFGYSVAVAGGTIVVGAPGDDDMGDGSGSAYVFVAPAGGWSDMTETAKLRASDGGITDSLGASAAISSTTVVVGASTADSYLGAAYVYEVPEAGWSAVASPVAETAKLTASDRELYDYFGNSVAISGETIIAAAQGDEANTGAFYVFDRPDTGWSHATETAKLIAPAGAIDDFFGYSVAIDGDMVIAGAWGDDENGSQAGAAYVFERVGSYWVVHEYKALASDGAASDSFGESVAISGDTLVVGAPQDDDLGSSSGSVYVFSRRSTNWVQEAKLLASDGFDGDYFGGSVAISGDTIVAGALGDDDFGLNSGSAYVFVKPSGGWTDATETAKLTASDGFNGDFFGDSVAISGDTIVVGAFKDDDLGNNSGSAYVYVQPPGGWISLATETAKLTASDGFDEDAFGDSVAISGDTIVVGAAYDDDLGGSSGSAYVFVKPAGDWSSATETAKLTASDGFLGDYFGNSVAISGDTLVVGAYYDNDLGTNSGSAYVFVKPAGGWISAAETRKLRAPDGAADDQFGRSVAISRDSIVVGAWYDDDLGDGSGSAHVFRSYGWMWGHEAKLLASDGAAGDRFGCAVAVDGDLTVTGALGAGAATGSAYGYLDDECNTTVFNTTTGSQHAGIADALIDASSGHELLANRGAFRDGEDIDYQGKAIALASERSVATPYSSTITLADASSLSAAEGYNMAIHGQLRTLSNTAADLYADKLYIGSGAVFNARVGSGLYVNAPSATVDGVMRLENNSTMSFCGSVRSRGLLTGLSGSSLLVDNELGLDGSGTLLSASVVAFGSISVGGALNASGGIFSAPVLAIAAGGQFTGYGEIYASVINSGQIYAVGDTLIVGDLLNNAGAIITIQIGTSTLIGSLINNGTIVGEIQSPGRSSGGDGFSIQGDYVAGTDSSLSMPDPAWRITVAGHYDVAIDDHARYDMVQAELRMAAPSGTTQTLEVMSTDIGVDFAGLDRSQPGHFPIGSLRIGPTAPIVELVDDHDNDGLGQAASEAVYVDTIQIDAGATLVNPSSVVYYRTLVNNGTVTHPDNLIRLCIDPDFDCDGDVQLDDHAVFAGCLNGPDVSTPPSGCTQNEFDLADLQGDDDVDLFDFSGFQAVFTGS